MGEEYIMPADRRRNTVILRGDILLADLSRAAGEETGGIRPVLVIQNDIGNAMSPTTIVAVITEKKDGPLPCGSFPIGTAGGKLSKESCAVFAQIRTVDRKRILRHLGRSGTDLSPESPAGIALAASFSGCVPELVFADLSPVIGCEQGGCRPVLVIGNTLPDLVTVAPVTKSRTKAKVPTHMFVGRAGGLLPEESTVLFEQIRTVDVHRVKRSLGVPEDTPEMREAMENCLGTSIFGIPAGGRHIFGGF